MSKLKLFFLITTTFLVVSLRAQFPRDLAIDIVLNHILVDDIENVKVYASFNAISIDTPLYLAFGAPIKCPYALNWVFFVDDMPFAAWEHPCRYIFVDANDGQYQIISDRPAYPWGIHHDFELIAVGPPPAQICDRPQPPSVNFSDQPYNPHLYAVLITGIDDTITDSTSPARPWNDLSLVYTTMEKVYHYDTAKMFVHYDTAIGSRGNDLDGGDYSNDIDYPAYKDAIHHTFICLAGDTTDPKIPKLQPDDQLFIFVGDHGGMIGSNHSYIWLPKYHTKNKGIDTLMDTTLANWTSRINCGQMIFVLEECHSGGFIPYLKDSSIYNFKCKNRSIYTSVTQSQTERFEEHISGDTYGEFIFYWTAAARGYFPDITHYKPWSNGFPVYDPVNYSVFPYANCFATCLGHPYYNPDINGDGFVTMEEAFAFARDYDTWDSAGYFCPIGSGLANLPTAQHYRNICFKEDLQSLGGLTGEISNHDTCENRSYVIGGPLWVDDSSSITFQDATTTDTSNVFFINDSARLVSNPGSSFNPGKGMLFAGVSGNNYVGIIDASMGNLNYVTFRNDSPGDTFEGLLLENTHATKIKHAKFINSGLWKFPTQALNVDSSSFKNCLWFNSQGGNINISNSLFNNTFVYLGSSTSGAVDTIENNTFSTSINPYNSDIIDVNNYDYFNIHDNTISSAEYAGIGLYDCGHGTSGNQKIYNNTITNCNVGLNVSFQMQLSKIIL